MTKLTPHEYYVKYALAKYITGKVVPRQATLEKFGLTIESYNKLRKEHGLPAIDYTLYQSGREHVPKQPKGKRARTKRGTFAPVLRLIEIKEGLLKLYETKDKGIRTAQTVESLNKAFRRCVEIAQADYTGDRDNIYPVLENPNKLLESLRNERWHLSEISIYTYYHAVVECLNKIFPHLYSPEIMQIYNETNDSLNVRQKSIRVSRMLNDSILPYNKVQKKIIAKFGKISKENLYIELMKQVIMRDDIGSIRFTKKEDIPNTGNWLLYRGHRNSSLLILQEYKTSNKHGRQEFELSSPIPWLISRLKYNEGDFIIESKINTNFTDNNLLSQWVSRMLHSAEIDTQDHGAVNFLRKSIISTELHTDSSPDRIQAIAHRAMHSPFMSVIYMRGLAEAEN
jgi:hypothetical protein